MFVETDASSINVFGSQSRDERELWPMVIGSTVFHVILFLLLSVVQMRPPHIEPPAYYVELADLKTPSGGASFVEPARRSSKLSTVTHKALPSPAQKTREKVAAPSSVNPTPSNPRKTALIRTAAPARSRSEDAEASALRKRMDALRDASEAAHANNAISALQRKSKNTSGHSTAEPSESSGGGYAQYVQAKLREAFIKTIAMQTKHPVVMASVTVDASGRLTLFKIISSSGDAVFEAAVGRAVDVFNHGLLLPPPSPGVEIKVAFRPELAAASR